tara:strand:- start:841 stop:1116 length:276 start_codon:yes stop_codon:yes gene_type:complete
LIKEIVKLDVLSISRNRKGDTMVVDESISSALNRIADNQEEMNETLKRIANHYDGVVPVMTRNAKRAESQAEELERGFAQQVKDIFRPQEN